MFRVLITDSLSPAGLKILDETSGIETDVRSGLSPEEVKEALKEADGIIIRSGTKLTPELLDGQERLKVIVRAGVGVDNIDLPAATREGIVVMNTPAGNTTSTAEHAIALMMALSRNIGPASASMSAGKWDRKKYTGSQLSGKTLAVVGLGRIGLSVAKRAQGLEMKVVGYDPFLSPDRAAELGIELYRDVDELIPLCDYLTVHTPLTDETRSLINKERFAKMKKGVRIINCARGGIVDEEDLVEAVEAGQVAGAALDVYISEPPQNERLIAEDRILKTPHLGASTEEAQELVAVEAADIISGYLLRNEIRYAINMAPISGTEMEDMRTWLDLTHRLGLLLAQLNKGGCVSKAKINYRGEISTRKTKLLTSSFATGLLESALNDSVNIVNAEVLAHDRGIEIVETSSQETSSFSSMVTVTLETDQGSLTAAGTTFGNDFVRLVRLDDFPLEAFLDGVLLIYRHRDVPGLIGFIGTVLGKHDVNIANMALGRSINQSGGDSIAVLNLDSEPSKEALKEILDHQEVTGVEIVKLPPADDCLPWMECE
jgi:D-3-phosphoglycerate dehydrogenase / 2-oxoglutarate reductase